ncbi:MAG: CDGSH-type Zn-finger protein [Verrucomicrobiales bacterium]|jgi:CDGSH-type Zn-finger protein
MSDEQPTIASKKPAVFKIEPGTYWWCSCGKSSNQPWCDGSHAGTGFQPKEVVIDEAKQVAMCNCKHSANKPFCDGAHASL